jgi:capsular exopolysaccharide synthesis family protein
MMSTDANGSTQALSVPVATHPGEGPVIAAAPALYGPLALAGEAPAGPPGLTAAPTLPGLLQALRRRWLLALGLAAGAAVLAVAAVFVFLPPYYVVLAQFNVSAAQDRGPFDATQDSHLEFAVFKEYQKALIRAPMVLTAALNEKVSAGREARDLPLVRAQGNGVIDWLDRTLKSEFKVAPEILSATLIGDDPEGLADLLNAIGSAFVKENDEKEKVRRKERLDLYREKLKLEEQNLSNLRAKLDAKRRPEDAKGRTKEQAEQDLFLFKARLTSVQLEQSRNELELADLQAKRDSAQTLPVPIDQVEDFLRNDGATKSMIAAMQPVQERIVEYERLGNPDAVRGLIASEKAKLKSLQNQVDKRRLDALPEIEVRYRARLKAELAEKIDSAERKRTHYAAAIKGLQDQIAALDPFGFNEPPDVLHLKDEIEGTKQAVTKIRETILLLGAEVSSSRVSFQMRAVAPTERDYSRQVKLAGAGSVSAFCLMLFGVALWEFRTRRISMTEEVSQGLALAVVGSLPLVRARAAGAARTSTPQAAARDLIVQSQLQEAIDGVRTRLLHTARSESMRVIMVASASPGEGKTSVATQLAASLARAWRKTLLIDGDLRNPAAHKVFDVPSEPGLSEVLRGEVAVEDVIRPASISRLWVLPAGHSDGHALQALAQDEVATLFAKLREQYDFIVVDSSPVLPVADTLLVAQHVDGVLFSVLRDVSRSPEVYAAQQRLVPLGVRTLGAVVIGMSGDAGGRAYRYAAS